MLAPVADERERERADLEDRLRAEEEMLHTVLLPEFEAREEETRREAEVFLDGSVWEEMSDEPHRHDTALHAACDLDDVALVRWVLEHGADPNTGRLPADHPFFFSDEGNTKTLLEQMARAPENRGDDTPLSRACRSWRGPSVCLLLVEFGADVNLAGPACPPPLVQACRSSLLPAAKWLVHHPDQRIEHDMLHCQLVALLASHRPELFEVAQALGRKLQPLGESWWHTPQLLTGHTRAALLWLGVGVDPNVRDTAGNTALHLLCTKRWGSTQALSLVGLLLDHGAHVDARDNSNTTPLLRACGVCNRPLVELLLARGADATSKDSDGWSAACFAAAGGDAELCFQMVRLGADPNHNGSARRSYFRHANLLLLACAKGHAQLAEHLLRDGANPDGDGMGDPPPLRAAVEAGHIAIVRLLYEHGARTCEPGVLLSAAVRGQWELTQFLAGLE